MDMQTLRTQYRVSDFVSWQRDDALRLNPNFQRRPVWKKGAKSFLIDTILRGLPMPIIFLRDLRADLKTLKAKRDVVDGQQRIRTILSYIDKNLLADFDPSRDEFTIDATHNHSLGGKSFNQLSPSDQQRILDYQFSVHSFPADTDDREILQIFARMNSTGIKLNAQELRNAEFYGYFKTLAYELATEQLNRWRDWRVFSPDQIARMNEVELTSEFMLLIVQGILEKKNATINDFYEKYDKGFPDGPEVARRFRSTFDAIETLLAHSVITKLFRKKTLFFGLFSAIYAMQYGALRSPAQKLYSADQITLRDLHSVYEALFLRAVTSFEVFLQELFVAILERRVRYRSRTVVVRMKATSTDALMEILHQNEKYLSWLPFKYTLDRAKLYLNDGKPFSDLSTGDQSIIKTITTIRHAVAHKSAHAMNEFRRTVIGAQSLLRGERSPAGYLRSQVRSGPAQNRFEVYVAELARITSSLC
jgi:Protein of unknown function DUF262